MESLKKIKNQKLLLVEGKDEEVFFKILLERKKIGGIQIMPSGGKQKFQKHLPALRKTPGFDKIISLAVIHDADESADKAFQSIQSALNNNELKSPDKIGKFVSSSPKVGVFIIPDGKSKGNLESLCLSTVKSNDIKCIDSFMDCIKQNSNNSSYNFPKNIYKARCRAFLSSMEEDTPSLGVAAQKAYWDFDSEKLNCLLSFLKQL